LIVAHHLDGTLVVGQGVVKGCLVFGQAQVILGFISLPRSAIDSTIAPDRSNPLPVFPRVADPKLRSS
jgi:hypothetical protein